MSTSGTDTYRTTRDDIIKGALRLLSAVDPENAAGPTANQITFGAEALNLMLKAWEAVGLQLWERKYGVIFPQKSQGQFVLGSPGPAGDHATLSTPLGSGFVQTTLAANAASGAGTISVTTTSGVSTVGIPAFTMANTFAIGIQLDDGTVQWTTINGAPSGTTITLTAVLTGAATAGNSVYCYQTKLVRPLRILDAFIRRNAGGNDIPVRIISADEYNRFGVKTSTGTPIQLAYNPQANAGHIYIYPTFLTCDMMLFIEFTKPMDDFSNSTDDYDMPQEWGEVLKFNLAMRLAPEYEVPKDKYDMIKEQALGLFELVKGYDQEPASLLVQPWDWMYSQQQTFK